MTWPDDDSERMLPDRLVGAFRRAATARVRSLPELQRVLGVDELEARGILLDLEGAGLAVGDADQFRLQPPDAAIGRYLERVSARIGGDLAGLAQLVASSGTLTALWRESFEHDAVDYTIDRIEDDGTAWFDWWSYLVEREGTEAVAIVSNLGALELMESAAPGHLDRLLGLLARGTTRLRLLVPPEARARPAADLMHRLSGAGAAIRIGDTSGWFAVASGALALVPAVWGRDRDVAALLLREPSILDGLESLFRLRWNAGSPWTAGAMRASSDPIIEALCRGATDGEVAERFSISVRSVRRRVAAALAETGVSSRMELGHLLGSRGAN